MKIAPAFQGPHGVNPVERWEENRGQTDVPRTHENDLRAFCSGQAENPGDGILQPVRIGEADHLPSLPGTGRRASSILGYRNGNPADISVFGTDPVLKRNSSSAISPNTACNMRDGIRNHVGRFTTPLSVLVNSRSVTGFGAHMFTGPERESVHRM